MSSNIINTSNNSFKFKDLPFIEYPIYIKDKSGNKYYSFKKAVVSSNFYSRTHQLNIYGRSIQANKFDALIDSGHFKLLNIPYKIYREVPIINTNLNNDSARSYYLLDSNQE